MSSGWFYFTTKDGQPAMARVCFTAAWHDPEWRERYGLPKDPPKRRRKAKEVER